MTQSKSSVDIKIREESPDDVAAISRVTAAAFLAARHTSHTEQFIVEALRQAGKLTVSRVATHNDEVVGHVAISPTAISGNEVGWFGLGPVSVLPSYQRRGIGSALIMDALLVLSSRGAAGCVVLGDPAFYERFGFNSNEALTLPGFPPQNLLAVAFDTSIPKGVVSYHDAFQVHS
jgi:predicted N-acetyltransferase YhbS